MKNRVQSVRSGPASASVRPVSKIPSDFRAHRTLLAAVCLSLLAANPVAAQSSEATVSRPDPARPPQAAPDMQERTDSQSIMVDAAAPAREIDMFVGESRVFAAPGVARIAVGSGQVITANALDGKDVIVFANGAGTTMLYVWTNDGRYQRVKVTVMANDVARYARDVASFLSTIPKTKATVVGDKVIVEGDDLSDADRDKVAELAKRYPQIVNFTGQIGWEQTVLMDVKVVEFPRSR